MVKRGKISLVASIGAILVGAAVGFMTGSQPQTTQQQPANDAQAQDTSKITTDTPKSSPMPIVAGKYISYDPTTFQSTTGTRLLFFHASWCPQCQKLDKSIVAQSKIPDNTTFFKVNYDTQNDLRAKYGVTLQTTIVKVDAAGNKIDSFVAYQDPSYDSVKNHFNLQ